MTEHTVNHEIADRGTYTYRPSIYGEIMRTMGRDEIARAIAYRTDVTMNSLRKVRKADLAAMLADFSTADAALEEAAAAKATRTVPAVDLLPGMVDTKGNRVLLVTKPHTYVWTVRWMTADGQRVVTEEPNGTVSTITVDSYHAAMRADAARAQRARARRLQPSTRAGLGRLYSRCIDRAYECLDRGENANHAYWARRADAFNGASIAVWAGEKATSTVPRADGLTDEEREHAADAAAISDLAMVALASAVADARAEEGTEEPTERDRLMEQVKSSASMYDALVTAATGEINEDCDYGAWIIQEGWCAPDDINGDDDIREIAERVIDEDVLEYVGIWEGSDKDSAEYKGCRVVVCLGGPHVELNTITRTWDGYWGGETVKVAASSEVCEYFDGRYDY